MQRVNRMSARSLVTLLLLIAAFQAASPAEIFAQGRGGRGGRGQAEAAPVIPGAYTQDQADAGAQAYVEGCQRCHQPDMGGTSEAPPLAGPAFRTKWGAQPVTDLLTLVQETMPPARPGSLGPEVYAQIVAHILDRNNVAPGQVALSTTSSGMVVPGSQPDATATAEIEP